MKHILNLHFGLSLIISCLTLTTFAQINRDTIVKTKINAFELFDETYDVSIMQLICSPEKYDGKQVQLIGYLHLEFEGDAIYLHQEDFEHSISKNALWVNFNKKLETSPHLLSDKYVIILGTFHKNDKGHMGLFSGAIDNIIRLDEWRVRK